MRSVIETRHLPVIRREGITWRTVGTDVQISIALHHDSPEPTADATLVIEAAAFGAFVPSQPIARIAVAGFEPDERRRVVTRVDRDVLDAIVDRDIFDRLPVQLQSFIRLRRLLASKYPSTNWVGNLNVYFEHAPEQAVERHVAFDLRVAPASDSGFRFVLEKGVYSLEARSSNPEWSAKALCEGEWVGYVIVTAPPRAGLKSKVDVVVTRIADRKTVLVEFELETVAGARDTLGCVKV